MNTTGRVQDAPETVHVVALTGCRTKADKIRYACDHLDQPATSEVIAWLMTYGIVKNPKTERSNVSTVVNEWRKERGMGDTAGNLTRLDDEMLAALDAQNTRVNASANTRTDTPANAFANTPGTAPDAFANTGQNTQNGRVREHPNGHQNGHVNASVERVPNASGRRPVPAAAWALYVIAGVSLAPSLDTSWRFFGEKLGIVGWERGAMFAVLELMLILSAVSMSANTASTGHPGPARVLVWASCGASAYMAVLLSGPFVGGVRIALGPLMGLLALHFALGVQIRARRGARATTWARIGRELRERALSRLGLADDARDALARTRERSAHRAARLALATWTPFRWSRVARNVARSGAAHDPGIRTRMLAELAALRHTRQLADLEQDSPWT